MSHILEADGIQLAFGNRRILSSIYVKCETGKITGLLGRNGQGKSCLMQIMYGTLDCEKSVRVDKISIRQICKRPDLVLYLPQFNFIPSSLSVKRVFQDFGVDFGVFADRFPEFAAKYKSSIQNLSGGGHRLVELYMIIKSKSNFAMLDEPFTHLSPVMVEKVKDLLLEEKKNKGFLITDHMYSQVVDICDHLYVLANGRTHLTKDLADIETLGYARI